MLIREPYLMLYQYCKTLFLFYFINNVKSVIDLSTAHIDVEVGCNSTNYKTDRTIKSPLIKSLCWGYRILYLQIHIMQWNLFLNHNVTYFTMSGYGSHNQFCTNTHTHTHPVHIFHRVSCIEKYPLVG